MEESSQRRAEASDRDPRPILILVALLIIAAVSAWLLQPIAQVLLLLFGGLLLALFFHTLGGWVGRLVRLPRPWSTVGAILLLATAAVGVALLTAPSVAEQADQLVRRLPDDLQKLTGRLERYGWGRWLLARLDAPGELVGGRRAVSQATAFLSSSAGLLGGMVVLLAIGIFVALEPEPYRRGLLRLTPQRKRQRLQQVLEDVVAALQKWLLAKVVAMLLVGGLTWLGLALLDVPLALILATLASVLTFIPNIGPFLAAIPAVLLGLQSGFGHALAVAALYVAIQTVESYIITPLIQRRAMALPPALVLGAQLLMAAAVGGLGIVLATPLLAAVIVLVDRFYVQDALGDKQT